MNNVQKLAVTLVLAPHNLLSQKNNAWPRRLNNTITAAQTIKGALVLEINGKTVKGAEGLGSVPFVLMRFILVDLFFNKLVECS